MSNPIRKVTILTTGGTIEKTYDEMDGSLANHETVIKNRIEQNLRLPYVKLEVKSLMNKDSLDMDEQDRGIIHLAIEKFATYGNPIVVLHGTDTMQQTAELVEKKMSKCEVPVIFTGAMKPLGFIDYINLQKQAACVISDSGTLMEESSLLGFPAIHIRDAYERPEGMDLGVLVLSPVDMNKMSEAVKMMMSEDSKKVASYPVKDYHIDNVSKTVTRIILSHIDFINKKVWNKAS